MNRPSADSLAIIVALTEPATPHLATSLARFADEAGPFGKVLLVDASGSMEGIGLARRLANVRVIPRPVGRLAPLLWRDGLLATDAELVAFTTSQMTPRTGWLEALKARLRETRAAGVGGPIEPGSNLSTTDRAVALLRYANYFPPLPDPSRVEPPGDNSLYLRDRLKEVESAWLDGFWEVGVHQALRDRGYVLAMAETAVVTFEGGVSLASMLRQRMRHARRYGAGRSKGLGTMARLARVATCPLVPPLLCGRIFKALRARRMALIPRLASLPKLGLLASAWAIGEAIGTWSGDSSLMEQPAPFDPSPQPSPTRGEGDHHRQGRDIGSFSHLAPSPLVGEGWGEGTTSVAPSRNSASTIKNMTS